MGAFDDITENIVNAYEFLLTDLCVSNRIGTNLAIRPPVGGGWFWVLVLLSIKYDCTVGGLDLAPELPAPVVVTGTTGIPPVSTKVRSKTVKSM